MQYLICWQPCLWLHVFFLQHFQAPAPVAHVDCRELVPSNPVKNCTLHYKLQRDISRVKCNRMIIYYTKMINSRVGMEEDGKNDEWCCYKFNTIISFCFVVELETGEKIYY